MNKTDLRPLAAKLAKCPTYQSRDGETLRDISDELHAALLAARVCPDCARYPEPLIRLRHCAETSQSLAGWECCQCEGFFEPEPSDYETCGCSDGPSDADPGL